VYDHEEKFIKTLLKELPKWLSPDGKLVLLYSNFGSLFGLQKSNFIEELCKSLSLQVQHKEEIPADTAKMLDTKDPLVHFKSQQMLQCFVITAQKS
jgi:hypothetical protein